MKRFEVKLSGIHSLDDFVTAFDTGFCRPVGGHLEKMNLDAFHDYLSWPEEDNYKLVFSGWHSSAQILAEVHPCSGKSYSEKLMEIFTDNPHITVVLD